MMAHKKSPTFRLRALSAALASCFASTVVLALPTGGSVVNGTATITQSGNVLTITNSSGAIINWQGFSIGAGETTRFIQPSSVSSVLNRVVTNDPSVLLGKLVSNGAVFLVNPAGILVGKDARIDVGAFVGSTLQISDADFLARRFNFVGTPDAGKLINNGKISTPNGGSVYLIAPEVENAGLIQAPSGEVILAAGQRVQIGDTATPGVRAEISGDGKVTNVGSIVASAGNIGLVGALVKNAGLLNASSAVSEGGRIYLRASKTVEQTDSGVMDASGTRGGSVLAKSDDMTLLDGSVLAVGHSDEGGEISALGDRVGIIGSAELDASGKTGGGRILVGGDYQGKNAAVQNADFTYVGAKTTLRADARDSGDGGTVIVWANDSARVHGQIYARGGGRDGDGGFVETSGKQFLDVAGVRVRTDGAAYGAAGNWLLDPNNLKIIHATSSGSDSGLAGSGSYFYSDTMVGGTYSTISDYTINQAIAGNSTVTLYAQNDVIFDGSYSGSVFINKQTSDTFPTTLSVSSGNNILFRGGTTFQTLGSTGSGGLTVNLSPGSGTSTIESSASLTLQGAATSVGLVVGAGSQKTLENYGTFNVKDNAYVDLESVGYYSSFINQASGTVNVATNGAGASVWPFQSDTMDGGSVFNHGIWYADLTNGSQSYEVIFVNDDTGATLNVINGGGSRYLSLQNADRLSAEINIDSGSTLWLSEMHFNTSSGGYYVHLDHANISGPGILKVGGGVNSVTAKIDGATLNSGLKLWEGATTGQLLFDGSQSQLNGSAIYSSNNLTVEDATMLALTGDVGFYSTGDLSIGDHSTSGKLFLLAGWNGSALTQTPGVSGAGSISINGAVSAGSDLWARATGDIMIEALDRAVSLTSGGAAQRLQAGNDIVVAAGLGRALLRYSGSGTQTLIADKIRVEAGGRSMDNITLLNNLSAKIESTASQNISAATSIVVQGGGNGTGGSGNFASILANGNQQITAPGILVAAGEGSFSNYKNYAEISQNSSTGKQKIVITGSSGLILTGGSGNGTYASSSSHCSGCMVSDNYAQIYNRGSGGQEIDFQASGAELKLQGGANGIQNSAVIENESSGLQKIWSSTSTRPNIVIKGGQSGGAYNAMHNENLGNEAAISSDANQYVRANNLTMDGGYLAAASPNYVSGAFLVGTNQDIELAGNLSMLAGGSTVAGQYGMGAPVVIGNDNGANIQLVVGGDISTQGHGTSSAAFIGAAQGDATIAIQAANMTFGNYTMLGNLDSTASGGSIDLTASSSGIALPGTASKMRTASLVAQAAGDITLGANNVIQHFDLSSSGGAIDLQTSNATTYLDSIVSQTGAVTVTNASGNLSLGTVEAASSVSLTARKAILDGNGSSVNNITASSVSLTSQRGGASNGLAISADVSAGSISAVVGSGGTANYGGVRLFSLGGPLSLLSITDTATSGGNVFFKQSGNFSTNANYSVSTSSGSIRFAGDGAMNLVGNAFFSAPLGYVFEAGTDLILGSMSFSEKASFTAGADIKVIGSVNATELSADAGGDLLVNSGKLYGSKVKLTVDGNLSMQGSGANNTAFIGAAQGDAVIEIQAGDMSFGSYSMLGNQDPAATGGSINLTASNGGIALSGTSSMMRTADLVAKATGNIDLAGDNAIKHVDLSSSGGNINLRTSNATTYVDNVLAQSGSVTITNAGGYLSVGTVEAAGSAALTANKAILDGNGDYVNNITASSVSLTSELGGASGELAISADVSAGSVSAVVGSGGSANYGGVRLVSLGGPLSSLRITDEATSGGAIFFQQIGDFSTNANYFVSTNSGSLNFATDGAMNLAGGSFSAPLGMAFVAGTDLTLGSLSLSEKAGFYAGGDITVNGMVFGSELEARAGGDLKVNSGGKLYASDKMKFTATNVRLDGGTLETGTGNIVGFISQDMILNNGSLVSAGDDVKLSFTGTSSKLVLNETSLMAPSFIRADVYTGVAATIYLDFVAQSAGGIVIDGVAGMGGAGGSGFYAAGAPAVLGSSLKVYYGLPIPGTPGSGGSGEFIKDVLTTTPPQTDTGLLTGGVTGGGNLLSGGTTGETGDNEFGGGSTTGENNEGRNRNRNRGGMCRG